MAGETVPQGNEEVQETGQGLKFSKEQQEFFDKRIGQARIKARELAMAEFEARSVKDKTVAEQTVLQAESKWKELSEMHETRVRELEPLEAKVKAFDELVAGMLKDRLKTLGKAAQKAVNALPGNLDDLDKLNWLNQNEGLFVDKSPPPPGTPRKKRAPAGAEGTSAAELGHHRSRL